MPVLITLRGTEPLVARFRLRRPQLCFALRHADRVVAVAPSLAADAVALGLPAGRVRVIDNGVDPERFRPLDRAACRRALGLPAGDPLLVAVGMLAPRKGFHLVIEALPRLVPRFPGLRFAIVGGPGAEGAMEAELRALALQLGVADRVVFAGVQPRGELPVWYSAADVSVLASGHEGCPNVVLESLACGTPVVATPVGSIPEILSGFARGARQADPQAGLLAERTVPALAAALGDALARSWDREAVRARVAARSWQAVGREVMEEIEAALTPRPPLPSPALVRRLS